MFRFIGRALSLVVLTALCTVFLPLLLVLAFLPEIEAMFRRWRPAAFPVAVAVFLIFAFSPVMAFAADNVVTSTAVDLSPILTALIEVAATIISALAVPMFWDLWTWLQKKTHLSTLAISDAQKAVIDQGLQKAIAYGVSRTNGAAAQLAAQGSLTVETKNAVVAQTLTFAETHIPDALAHFGLSLKETPDAIAAMIEARLGLLAIGKATNPVSAGTAMATDPAPAAAG